ncbi:uncharacterized protein E0L32_000638 [Thyridium curvatum]|uniref:Uncharacterized protein n=1 Tax=Thyridium curvatum TaxID=1093900 RepID=A0A507B698_9PEZI|nr:uncharacterized protein E0L32_000638 [Thyridium curvatum]TPX14244.1 hypothetical protein E0L32_000638 [Thyridium curvatum]
MPGVTIPPGTKPAGASSSSSSSNSAGTQAGRITQIQPPQQHQRAPAGTSTTASQRPPSPTPPTVEPISPITKPAYLDGASTGSGTHYLPNFSEGRQSFTFSSPTTLVHPDSDATAIPAPRPIPIDLESNPDVLALRSAVTILQLQKRKAEADVVALQRAKEAAMADPEGFARDLAEGKVHKQGDALFPSAPAQDDDDDDDDDDDEEMQDATDGVASRKSGGAKDALWRELPQPQNVVRMPPVNWSKYAVVGESLDKLHNEQLSRPTPGAPAVIGPNGTYEFKSGGEQPQAESKKLVGIAAPYNPSRDKLEKKSKGTKR